MTTQEPLFLDDESLTDNLDEEQASRVIDWLIHVFNHSPENITQALTEAKALNQQSTSADVFAQNMTELEEKYG